MRAVASKQNQVEYMALWAGQGLRFIHEENHAKNIIRDILDEAEKILR